MVAWTRIAGLRAVNAVGLDASGITDGPIRIHVRFRRGRTYVYDVGSRDYFDRFVGAASKGRFYVFIIKERFDYIAKY